MTSRRTAVTAASAAGAAGAATAVRGVIDAVQVVRDAARCLLDLGLPASCAGCAAPGEPLCPRCRASIRQVAFPAARVVAPQPTPPGLPPVLAAGRYDGVLRRLVTAYKDDERRDLRGVLAALLATALTGVACDWATAVVVPMPSSPSAVRRRGDDPVGDLVRVAARARSPSPRVLPALRTTRALADQSRLDHRQRAANLAGAYQVRPRHAPALAGAVVVLADDVVTTGATLAEAARAVRAAGGVVAAAAVVAATSRRGLPHATGDGRG